MRRSIFAILAAASAVVAASPAVAAPKGGTTIMTLPATVGACSTALTNPNAIACAGYYGGNLISGNSGDIQDQKDAVALLGGTWSGNFDEAFKLSGSGDLTNGNQLNFGTTMFGQTIIGAHYGNVDGDAGNVTVFWLFDFGTTGANYVTLTPTNGWSNAYLYTTGNPPAVPEPATWAMMLLGFGAAGTAIRRSRRSNGQIAQLA